MKINQPKIPVVIITSTALRHKYFVNSLMDDLEVAGVVSEEKHTLSNPEGKEGIVKKHLEEFKEAENCFFGEHPSFNLPDKDIFYIPRGQSNSSETFSWIREREPQYLILFGSAIIKPPLLSYYDGKIVNLHLGLSPYYRGSGSNFWPLVFGEPEGVGATIHLAVLKVDAGPILGQVRPEVSISDRSHELGCKTVIAGTKLLPRILAAYNQKRIIPREQDFSIGKIFRKKDLTPEAVIKMRQNFSAGMIKEFLDGREERVKNFPLVEFD